MIVSRRIDRTIERGLKLRPVTDPPLAALVERWRIDRTDIDRTLSPELVTGLTATFTLLLPYLAPSSWHPKMSGITGLFTAAAVAGVAVNAG